MSSARGTAVALALCAVAAAGCGLGPGAVGGEAELTVTRDYGAELLFRGDDEVGESDTVMRLLDRELEVETRYGGGFVQSIDGIAGGQEDGRRLDWFFYVNGIESPVGSADYRPEGGDRIWWDYRDWTEAMRVPAVVGSYPEPFLHGFRGAGWPVRLGCFGRAGSCEAVRAELEDAGVSEIGRAGLRSDDDAIRVLVGPWRRISGDDVAGRLSAGPAESGVFARFEDAAGATALSLVDQEGAARARGCRRSGLVAALRPGEGPPTWVVTGTDDFGVGLAAGAIGPGLRERFAAAVTPSRDGGSQLVSLPVAASAEVPAETGCARVAG